MRCIVTGAGGFIGSSICDRLLTQGHEVVGIDCFVDYYPKEMKLANLKQARSYTNFSFIEDNILDIDCVKLLDGAQKVFHQAAQAGVRASWGDYFSSYTENNILVTQKILESAKKVNSIEKIVFASSSSVYGDAERLPTQETLRPQPVSPYGVTKLAAEHLMSLYATEFAIPTVSLRYFTVYGPRQRPDMAFHRFLRAALEGETLTLYGDGEQSRDFTYIDDIVEANLLASDYKEHGRVFNIGGGSVSTVNEVLAKVKDLVGACEVERFERQTGDARHTSADTSAAKQAFGYAPQVNLDEGLRREFDWIKEHLS